MITTTFSLILPLIKVKQMQVMKLTKFKKGLAFSVKKLFKSVTNYMKESTKKSINTSN